MGLTGPLLLSPASTISPPHSPHISCPPDPTLPATPLIIPSSPIPLRLFSSLPPPIPASPAATSATAADANCLCQLQTARTACRLLKCLASLDLLLLACSCCQAVASLLAPPTVASFSCLTPAPLPSTPRLPLASPLPHTTPLLLKPPLSPSAPRSLGPSALQFACQAPSTSPSAPLPPLVPRCPFPCPFASSAQGSAES